MGASTAAAERFETRICHFSVQHNHLHLIVEAASNEWFSKALQGLSTRLAISLNRLREEHGKLFADRYYAHVLRTPTEVRRAVSYVLDNHVKHSRGGNRGPDFYSSAVWPVVVAPKTDCFERIEGRERLLKRSGANFVCRFHGSRPTRVTPFETPSRAGSARHPPAGVDARAAA